MAKEGDYTISEIYQGGYSSIKPEKNGIYTGTHIPASEIGMTTDPRSANQLGALSQSLNQGAIPIEVGALQPEVFDQIPKQHFKEMNRLSKLTGSKISVHAPIIEPSGITQDGWTESNRQLAERQLLDVVNKSADIEANLPVTIHSSGLPGKEYVMTKDGKKVEKLIVINQETHKMAPLKEEIKHYPGVEDLAKGITYSPEKELKVLNDNEWDNSLSQVIFYKEGADKILSENYAPIAGLFKNIAKQQEETGKVDFSKFTKTELEVYGHVQNAGEYLKNTQQHLGGMFNKAWKYGTEEDKEILQKISSQFQKDLEKDKTPIGQSSAIQGLVQGLQNVTPQVYKPIEEFAIEKSSETFANVAFEAFKKNKEKTPKISIENMYPGIAFSSSEDLNNLITETKNRFVLKAMDNGYGKSAAQKKADEIIGVTLDVGHLNIARKKGFKDEDLAKEAEAIAKNVKHVHLHDNFGYGDSHLPPGMGNVPFKEMMEKLDKEGFKGRKIVEALGWFEHFKTSPYAMALEAMGSPIYSMQMSPYWNQNLGFSQGYFGGYGAMLPQKNYETFGAGFSQLPQELGGQVQGRGGRMSGTPME